MATTRRFDRFPFRRAVKGAVRGLAKAEGIVAYPGRRRYARAGGDLRLPDFLGLGAIKSASTWLYRNLQCHPALFLPDRKELHYFTLRMHKRLRWYADQFAPAGVRVCGEITPAYSLLSSDRVALVHRLMPDAKLLMVLRNPVDRAWAHAVMKLGRERHRPIEDVPQAEVLEFLASPWCIAAGDYASIVTRWRGVYPPERLLLLLYDDVVQRPDQVLDQTFRHLGVSAEIDRETFPMDVIIDRGAGGSGEIVGKPATTTVPDDVREYLRELYRDQLEAIANTIGGGTVAWLEAAT